MNNPETVTRNMTEEQAYMAMFLYLEQYLAESGLDDLKCVISDLLFTLDGTTMDPATWANWLEAVDSVLLHKYTRYDKHFQIKIH